MVKTVLGKLTTHRHLNGDEISVFIKAIADAEVSDAQIATFQVALLMKGASNEELAAFAKSMLQNCVPKAYDIGLEVLAETHSEHELALAKRLNASIVGINNRNIGVLEKDDGSVELTERLAALAPANALLVSESGINTAADVKCAIQSGADAVLVGTAILKAKNTALFYKSLTEACL